jgi:hypothetical protein
MYGFLKQLTLDSPTQSLVMTDNNNINNNNNNNNCHHHHHHRRRRHLNTGHTE